MDACAHCLRPTFTARISRDLERRAAINLIATPGQGADRLLEDLRHLPSPGKRLVVNLKRYRTSLSGLVADLWHQIGGDGTPPGNFSALCDRLERQAAGGALLLDHFDALLENPELDPSYDDRFIDALNALRNRGLALICVTARPLDQSVILVGKDGVRRGSTLDLSREDLPLLAHAEIRAEIDRLDPPLDAGERDRLAAAVNKKVEMRPLGLLDLANRRLNDGVQSHWSLRKRLRRWQREFAAQRDPFGPRQIVSLRHKLTTLWRASQIGRLLPLGRLVRWVAGLVPRRGKDAD